MTTVYIVIDTATTIIFFVLFFVFLLSFNMPLSLQKWYGVENDIFFLHVPIEWENPIIQFFFVPFKFV